MTALAGLVLSIGWFGLVVVFAFLGVLAVVVIARASAARNGGESHIPKS